jgi:hypothetical protein
MLTDVSEESTASVSTLKMEVACSFESYQATVPYFIYLLSEFFNDADSSHMISEWLLKKTWKAAVVA